MIVATGLQFKKVVVWCFRFLFLCLIVFEFLNLRKILHFPLDFSWLGLIITSLLVWITVELTIYLLKSPEQLPAILGLSLMLVFLDASGDIFRFYSQFGFYDRLLHFVAGAVIAYILFVLIQKFFINFRFCRFFCALLIIGTTNLFGALYEIEEYLEDVFVHHRPLRLGDGPDTADDLLMNLLGSIFMISAIIILKKF